MHFWSFSKCDHFHWKFYHGNLFPLCHIVINRLMFRYIRVMFVAWQSKSLLKYKEIEKVLNFSVMQMNMKTLHHTSERWIKGKKELHLQAKMYCKSLDCKYLILKSNIGILFPKWFWPNVRKKNSEKSRKIAISMRINARISVSVCHTDSITLVRQKLGW